MTSLTIPKAEFLITDIAVEISLDRYLKRKADAQDLQDLCVNLVLTQAIDDQCFQGANSRALSEARRVLLDRIHDPECMTDAIIIRYHHLLNITRWQFARAVDFCEDYFGE